MKQLIKKIALFLGYAVFAGYSSWMTATSVQLKWMTQMPVWFVFVMVFIIALSAGWCLGNVIKELKNSINPSKFRFTINLIGFMVFWTFSFMTNVHYNAIQEYGESNLSAQLADCKRYLIANSDEALTKVENQRDAAIKRFADNMHILRQAFVNEALNESGGGQLVGLGPKAKEKLKDIEVYLNKSAKLYNDAFNYTSNLYNETNDNAYSRFHGRKEVSEIVKPHFSERIDRAEDMHKKAIEAFYQKQINAIKDNKGHLNTVAQFEKMLQRMKMDGNNSFEDYYSFYKSMDENLLSKVSGYKEKNIKYVKNEERKMVFNGYNVYPSDRMFNFWDVWSDWFNGYLPDNISLVGQFLWAAIVDVIAFILVSLIF